MNAYRYPVPASFFGMILGLVGVGNAWRLASVLWQAPIAIGHVTMWVAAAVWLLLMVLYAGKWIYARELALAEIRHPVQAGFVSLVPLTTMLMALVVMPYGHAVAVAFWVIGIVGQLAFGLYFMGKFWQGGREAQSSTTSLYLPTVGVNLVAAIVGGTLGYPEWGALFFGVGVLSWLSIESLVLHRHAVLAPLPLAIRATVGIQLAPPVVGAMAYLSITTGAPDLFVRALFGYGIFQGLLLVRLVPWFRQQAFGASAWAFTFGVTALAAVPMRMVERGGTGPELLLVVPLFVFANVFVAALVLGTLRLALRGKLLFVPPTDPTPSAALPGAGQESRS